jgi:hypothetical protein
MYMYMQIYASWILSLCLYIYIYLYIYSHLDGVGQHDGAAHVPHHVLRRELAQRGEERRALAPPPLPKHPVHPRRARLATHPPAEEVKQQRRGEDLVCV